MIEPMLFFWKLYVDGSDHGISNQVDKSCLSINKPTIKVNLGTVTLLSFVFICILACNDTLSD